MSRRKAPKRGVKEVWRSGYWGNYQWNHELACGHIESRKRKAPAKRIGCEECLGEVKLVPEVMSPEFDLSDEALRMEARLRARAGLGADATVTITGDIATVRLVLDVQSLRDLIERTT